MRKSIAFIIIALICLTGYSRTPEDYLDAEYQGQLDERIAGCRTSCRPTDPLYINLIQEKADRSFKPQPVEPEEERYYRQEDPTARYFHTAAILWTDLLLWDSISKDEYEQFCMGDPIPFLIYDRYGMDEPDRWTYFGPHSAISYYGVLYPDETLVICGANEQLAKRIYGIASESYRQAAEYYLEALRIACEKRPSDAEGTKQKMERAKILCEDILKNSHLDKNSNDYYEWLFNAYRCRLSVHGGNKKIQKEIDKTAKAVSVLNDTVLIELYAELQAECAMLSKDYAHAVQLLTNAIEKTSEYKQLPYIFSLIHAYVLAEEYEKAEPLLGVVFDIISQGSLALPRDPVYIGRDMLSFCPFSTFGIFPYRLELIKQYENRITTHYGFQIEE